MGDPINGGGASPISQSQTAGTENQKPITEQVTVNGKSYNASKAKVWGLRIARELFSVHGLIKPAYNHFHDKLHSHRSDENVATSPNTTDIKTRSVVRHDPDLGPSIKPSKQPESSPVRSEQDDIAARENLLTRFNNETFGMKARDADPFMREIDKFESKAQLQQLKSDLTDAGQTEKHQTIRMINTRIAEMEGKIPDDKTNRIAAREISDELSEWGDTLPKNQFTKPSAEVKSHFRYGGTAGEFAPHTAIKLPVDGGLPELRLSANKVTPAPGEPPTIMMQAPTTKAMGDMWHAMFKEDVPVIVDLTQVKELKIAAGSTKPKVDKYYPDQGGLPMKFKSGDKEFSVRHKSTEKLANGLVKSEYLVKDRLTQETKTIHRLHVQNWVDHDGIKPEDLKKAIEETDKLANGKTVAVHCSAGIGRTGTFTATRTALHQSNGQQPTLDEAKEQLTSITKELRTQRNPTAIQEVSQFKTALKALTLTPEPVYAQFDHGAKDAAKLRKASQDENYENTSFGQIRDSSIEEVPEEEDNIEPPPILTPSPAPDDVEVPDSPPVSRRTASIRPQNADQLLDKITQGGYGESPDTFNSQKLVADLIPVLRQADQAQFTDLLNYTETLKNTQGWQEVGLAAEQAINDHMQNRPPNAVDQLNRPGGQVRS